MSEIEQPESTQNQKFEQSSVVGQVGQSDQEQVQNQGDGNHTNISKYIFNLNLLPLATIFLVIGMFLYLSTYFSGRENKKIQISSDAPRQQTIPDFQERGNGSVVMVMPKQQENTELSVAWENALNADPANLPTDKQIRFLSKDNNEKELECLLSITSASPESNMENWQIKSKKEALFMIAIFLIRGYGTKDEVRKSFTQGEVVGVEYYLEGKKIYLTFNTKGKCYDKK
ncbi:MAG: hypothetical protein SGJ02_11980 [bacterium]|nr:hypothetical protein [bacterium]